MTGRLLLPPSLFWAGLLVALAGIAACGYIFAVEQKTTESFVLDTAQTGSASQHLDAGGAGFYRVYSPSFGGEAVFVRVLDPGGNIIADKRIQTKMAVNYFDVTQDGAYTVVATSLAGDSRPAYIEIEYGRTGSEHLTYPGAAVLAGTVMMVIAGYRRLVSYSMAQPDENAS